MELVQLAMPGVALDPLRGSGPVVLDPSKRTHNATRKRMRKAEHRYADVLRQRGWTVLPPAEEQG
jgi:hypothetical protein